MRPEAVTIVENIMQRLIQYSVDRHSGAVDSWVSVIDTRKEIAKLVKDLVAARAEQERLTWQPIETAPKDRETWVLVTGCNTSPMVLVAGYDPFSNQWRCYGAIHISNPTH